MSRAAGIVSTLGVAIGVLFCGGVICAAAALPRHDDNKTTSAVRRITQNSYGRKVGRL
jgi:hypothetical protein